MVRLALIPKLRFSEFKEDWNHTTLGKIAKFWNGQAHEKEISDSGRYVVINSKFISSDGLVRKYCNEQLAPLSKDDIAIVMSDIPKGRALAKCFLIDEDNKYTLNQRIGGFRSLQIISPFLIRLVSRNKYFLEFDNGVSQTNLRKDEILKCPITFPSPFEQQKIADFLTKVDTWIENLRQQKENLEKYKKGLMQKIFSKKIRFKDENGKNYPEWDQKKLEKICEYKNGGSYENQIVEDGKYNLITLNSIDINGSLKKDHKRVNSANWCLQKNDLVMVLSDVAHGNFLGLVDIIPENDKYVLNQRMGLLKITDHNIDIHFLREMINFNQRYFKDHGQGSSQLNLSKGDILNFLSKYPSLKEQTKIANFFTSLDKAVDSKKQQISLAEKWKKGLMQQMFI